MFSCFKNPDKETVLTPWKVVNMHMSDCLGGYKFYDDENQYPIENPNLIEQGDVTSKSLSNKDAKILEINSKTGLYPLYVAYSIYQTKCNSYNIQDLTLKLQDELWEETISNNVYVICKTPMAKAITRRTLVGFKPIKVNAHYFDDLVNMMENKPKQFIDRISKPNYWKKEGIKNMKFDAIVGNPPYNIIDGGGGSSARPIYNCFVETAIKCNPAYISMIIPSRWFSGGKGLNEFRKNMINDQRIRILHDYRDARECFNNVNIEGGVCYFLWNRDESGKCKLFNHIGDGTVKLQERILSDDEEIDIVIRDVESIEILKKVKKLSEKEFSTLVHSRNYFKISNDFVDYLSDVKTSYNLLCRINNNRQKVYLKENYSFNKDIKSINSYKIFMSKADGAAGQLGNPIPAKIIGKPEKGYPNDLCSETFLYVGGFESESEMLNVEKYLRTKFARFLIGIRKNKNMTQDTYKFLPIQDFKNNDIISWDKPLKEIDKILYKKYNLTQEEIEFIEKMIAE